MDGIWREPFFQESATLKKLAVMVEQSCTQITAKPRVASTSPRSLDHQAWARFFWVGYQKLFLFFYFFAQLPSPPGRGGQRETRTFVLKTLRKKSSVANVLVLCKHATTSPLNFNFLKARARELSDK